MSPPRNRSNLAPEPLGSAARLLDGRTPPPPAPSSVYARRAVDATGEGASYSLDVQDTDAGSNAVGYRRARAGTMPSSLPDNAQRLSSDDSQTSSATTQPAPARTSALFPAYPPANAGRPTLRHTHTMSGASLDGITGATGNRNRSGSLTTPQDSLRNPFGGAAFGNGGSGGGGHGWPGQPGLARSPLVFHGSNDQSSSLTSPVDNLGHQELNFSTLDYLGLADPAEIPPASVSGLREQQASRLRASTVSNFNRPFSAAVSPNAYYDHSQEAQLARAIGELGMSDSDQGYGADLYGGSSYHKDSNRPRATTIGAMDGPNRRTPSGYLASIPQSPVHGTHMSSLSVSSAYGYPPRSRSERDLGRSRDSSRASRLSISSHTSRTGTPDITGTSTPQMPTRSLWVGNLDVNATSEALLTVFSPYGSIESVRMLPEKTCAFVNFMEKSDAVRARDDVLNRLGGHVTALSETAPVRIGFGKIDSAPSGPPSSTVTPAPSGLVFTHGKSASMSTTTPVSMVIPPPNPNADLGLDNGTEHSALPTRALWIGSIPGTTSSSTLLQIFSPFGPVESARVLMHKACGFINFERLDSAISARNALNGRDILGSDVGAIRIGFARVPTRSPTIGSAEEEEPGQSPKKLSEQLSTVNGAGAVPPEQQMSVEGGGLENFRSKLVLDLVKAGVHEKVLEKGLAKGGEVTDSQMIMQVLSAERDPDEDIAAAAESRAPATYYTSIPIITDRPQRRFDTGRLKELRKRLDSNMCSTEEIDSIARDLLDDAAELSSDYIGNTVIQKVFERTSRHLRFALLERIAPHLAMIGIHKNGTWAAQKIIECSKTEEEQALIAKHLTPFAPPLMCDSLGNYVCAGTLRFGSPHSDYVFDAMMDRMWDIAQNRFGARCMRTCLESQYTSLYQKKRISTGIILNSIPLATNPNGALLLTWLVDQSNLPGRYGLLAGRFVPHIAHLCTHKLASLTVLRVITQSSEPSAATTLINSIFSSPNDTAITEILSDANNGAQVIGKMLAVSNLPEGEREKMIEVVRRVLPTIKASSTPPYRMLLEAVGLPVPAGHLGAGGYNGARGYGGGGGRGGYGYGGYGYPGASSPPLGHSSSPGPQMPYGSMGQSLTPILVANNMSLGGPGTPSTPIARQRGRLSPGAQMMSPASDPFNPFASPSIDVPYMQSRVGGMRLAQHGPLTYESQANAGLGVGLPQNVGSTAGQMYFQPNMVRPNMFAYQV